MADYNYLQDIMDSVYGSQYWDQMADDYYRPEQNQQDDERLLDLIRGESRRTALPGGNRGGNAGANPAMQPVPQAPDMVAMESGRNNQAFQDKLNGLDPAYPAQAAASSPVAATYKNTGSAQDLASYASIAAEYGGQVDAQGNITIGQSGYEQMKADPRLSVNRQPAAVAAPVAAKPKTPTIGATSTAAPKPAAAASTTQASSFGIATPKKPTVNKPNAQSGGIQF